MISPFNRLFTRSFFLFYHLISRSTIYFSLLMENKQATNVSKPFNSDLSTERLTHLYFREDSIAFSPFA